MDEAEPHNAPDLDNSDDALRELRAHSIGASTKGSYLGPAIRFLEYSSSKDRAYMNQAFVDALMVDLRSDIKATKEAAFQKLKEAVMHPDRTFSPFEGPGPSVDDVAKYLQQLKKLNGEDVGMSTLKTARSAIQWVMKSFGHPVSKEFQSEMKVVFAAFARTNAKAVAQGKREIRVGKVELTYEQYIHLAEQLLDLVDDTLFGHCALVLAWNLMARVGNVMHILLDHLGVKGDHLLAYFSHLKNDQEGITSRFPRALYANPKQPVSCPMLAIGLYFLANSFTSNEKHLFPGNHQYERLVKLLDRAFETEAMKKVCLETGLNADDVATHSLRKGAATYVSSGSTSGPSHAAISNRAGWTMDGVKNIYLRHADAGDQYVGRCVVGLNLLSADFDVLPPHFPPGHNVLLLAIPIVFPNAPEALHGVLSLCLASVVYHADYLRARWPANHVVLQSALFTVSVDLDDGVSRLSLLQALQSILCKGGADCDHMHATGVPDHVVTLRETVKAREACDAVVRRVEELVPNVVNGVEAMLEGRALDSGQVTRAGLREMLEDVVSHHINNIGGHRNHGDDPNALEPGTAAVDARGPFRLFFYDGRYNKVPKDYKFTSGGCKEVFFQWYLGNSDHGIAPLKSLVPSDLPSRGLAKRLSDVNYLMDSFVKVLENKEKLIKKPTAREVADMWSVIADWLEETCAPLTSRSSRIGQFKWRTIVNKLRELNRKAWLSTSFFIFFRCVGLTIHATRLMPLQHKPTGHAITMTMRNQKLWPQRSLRRKTKTTLCQARDRGMLRSTSSVTLKTWSPVHLRPAMMTMTALALQHSAAAGAPLAVPSCPCSSHLPSEACALLMQPVPVQQLSHSRKRRTCSVPYGRARDTDVVATGFAEDEMIKAHDITHLTDDPLKRRKVQRRQAANSCLFFFRFREAPYRDNAVSRVS